MSLGQVLEVLVTSALTSCSEDPDGPRRVLDPRALCPGWDPVAPFPGFRCITNLSATRQRQPLTAEQESREGQQQEKNPGIPMMRGRVCLRLQARPGRPLVSLQVPGMLTR